MDLGLDIEFLWRYRTSTVCMIFGVWLFARDRGEGGEGIDYYY